MSNLPCVTVIVPTKRSSRRFSPATLALSLAPICNSRQSTLCYPRSSNTVLFCACYDHHKITNKMCIQIPFALYIKFVATRATQVLTLACSLCRFSPVNCRFPIETFRLSSGQSIARKQGDTLYCWLAIQSILYTVIPVANIFDDNRFYTHVA